MSSRLRLGSALSLVAFASACAAPPDTPIDSRAAAATYLPTSATNLTVDSSLSASLATVSNPLYPDTCTPALQSWTWDKWSQKWVLAPNPNLDDVLYACPSLRSSIRWLEGDGRVLGYEELSEARRSVLATFYYLAVYGATVLPLDCPTPERNLAPWAYGGRVAGPLYFGVEQAFSLFAAQVAHALALEARRELPWQLRSFPAAERAAILSSDRMFATIVPGATTLPSGLLAGRDLQLAPARIHAPTYVCQPAQAYGFVRGLSTSGLDLVGGSADQTLANLTLFVARNLRHGPTATPDRVLATYGFDTPGRLQRRNDLSYSGQLAAPAGCHTAAALLQDLARSVNLPVENVALLAYSDVVGPLHYRTHRGLAYRWTTAPRYLEHADDAYAMGIYGLALNPLGQTASSAQRFFDTVWSTPAQLAAAGATIFSDLPMVTVGTGFGAGADRTETYTHYGRLLGYWPDAHPSTASRRWSEYVARREEPMCSPRLVGDYCRNLSTGWGWRNFQLLSSSAIPYLANETDARRAWSTVEACVQSVGGCSVAPALSRRDGPAETAWLE